MNSHSNAKMRSLYGGSITEFQESVTSFTPHCVNFVIIVSKLKRKDVF